MYTHAPRQSSTNPPWRSTALIIVHCSCHPTLYTSSTIIVSKKVFYNRHENANLPLNSGTHACIIILGRSNFLLRFPCACDMYRERIERRSCVFRFFLGRGCEGFWEPGHNLAVRLGRANYDDKPGILIKAKSILNHPPQGIPNHNNMWPLRASKCIVKVRTLQGRSFMRTTRGYFVPMLKKKNKKSLRGDRRPKQIQKIHYNISYSNPQPLRLFYYILQSFKQGHIHRPYPHHLLDQKDKEKESCPAVNPLTARRH